MSNAGDCTGNNHGDATLIGRDFQSIYSGARGSNTGDEFHELWAVRQALRMLNSSSRLTAIMVEGVPAPDSAGSSWDGVDCTLLFGGYDVADAEHVEIQQLKYSAGSPTKNWTVSRVCRGRNGKPSTSLMRRMGTVFSALDERRKGKGIESVKISLVTNQPISPELIGIMRSARNEVPASFKGAWKLGEPKLHRLVHASGLSTTEFKRFATVIDFHGNSGSRFALEDNILGAIANWQDTEFRETSNRLREYIRKRMLPEAAEELITKQMVLIQFGVSDEGALFPCPSAIPSVADPVLRDASKQVATAMSCGTQRICCHGTAGVGKTTALQEIATLLPVGSEIIVFDCYGAGSYLDASKLRHRPRDAFLQLSNELAQRLRLPALLEPNATGDHARAFRRRLNVAAETLKSSHPKALLVIAVDAADNSIMAAKNQGRNETSFVTELLSFGELPSNVCMVVSARTGRLDELLLPSEFECIEIPPFSKDETTTNVKRYWNAPHGWVEDYHHLSGGIPRVQAYAFEQAGRDVEQALDRLRPKGKQLDDIFDELFQIADKKAGMIDFIQRVCAGLSILPRPIPVAELAHVIEIPESQVVDVCADLAPGIRSEDNLLSFADEDFEEYIRAKAINFTEEVKTRAAQRALENAGGDHYAARNVAHLLFVAGRHEELLHFVEKDPEPPVEAIPDPVHRREIHDQRLLTAIRVCRQANDVAGALRFVLIGAEAMRTNLATRSLLASFPRLAVRFAKETTSRLILGNPDHVAQHGPLILQSLAHDATNGDQIGFREGKRRLNAWITARRDDYRSIFDQHGRAEAWTIKPRDVAAGLFGTAILEGADAAITRFAQIRPFRFAVAVAEVFVDRLIAERRFELAVAISGKCRPWQQVFLLVPLARAGRQIDLNRLVSGLTALKKRFRLDADTLDPIHHDNGIGSYVIDTILSAIEILVGHGIQTNLTSSILSPFLDHDLRRVDKRREFEIPLLDAILRSFCLSEVMSGKQVMGSDVLTPRPIPNNEKEIDKASSQHETGDDRRMKELASVITPIYFRRAKIIVAAGSGHINEIDLGGFETGFGKNAWRIRRRPNRTGYGTIIANGLTIFLALGADPREVLKCAIGMHGHIRTGTRRLVERLTPVPSLHASLINEIIDAVSSIEKERTGATDRSQKLAEFAEWLIPISSDDADAVFQTAVTVASELDTEAMDQIRFIKAMVDRGTIELSKGERRSYASVLAEIVNDAAIRLKDVDGFPWDEAMSAIASLDVPTAVAGVARWDDCRVKDVGTMLPPVIAVGLSADELHTRQAAALLCLLGPPPPNLPTSIVTRSINEGPSAVSGMAEEFARDSLIGIIPSDDELETLIVNHGQGEWTRAFRRQARFCKTLPDEKQEHNDDWYDRASTDSSIVDRHVWEQTTLVSSGKLLAEAENIVAQSTSADEFTSLRYVLGSAAAMVGVGNRSKHLDALSRIVNHEEGGQILDAILGSAHDWSGQPAVNRWCKDNLPRLLADHLPHFTRYLPWEDNRLGPALTLARLNSKEAQAVLLEGIERHSAKLDARLLFILSGIIITNMESDESADLCGWYLKRLLNRIPEDVREKVDSNDLPVTVTSAVARIFYAYLSDVDIRQRWRAAHALRRLARLGDGETLAEIVAQYDRVTECIFRARKAPFYWLAARLWLVIALDRISEETPDAAKPHRYMLLDICSCDKFPHVLLRAYAADACQKLKANGQLQLDAIQKTRLESVNSGSIVSGEWTRLGSFDLYRRDDHDHRFRFDYLDTLPYWYDRWLSVFWKLTPDDFIKAVESWIVDEWGIVDRSDTSRYQDPRPQHFKERDWTLSVHQHGQVPTLERYHSHLEWHAMWCAVGQLMKTHSIRKVDYENSDEMTLRISQDKLTYPPMWLSDLLGPVPLQSYRWRPIVEDIDEWLGDISDESLLRELFPVDRKGWVVVSAHIELSSDYRREVVAISTALVSSVLSHALVRALQTVNSQYDFHLAPEGPSLQVDQSNYKLGGWLKHFDMDFRFDRNDPYCGSAGHPQGLPGTAAVRHLDLEERCSSGSLRWCRKGGDFPSFVYEAWSQDQDADAFYTPSGTGVVFSGHRTLVEKGELAKFLDTEKRDLIAEIGVTRHDRRKREPSYDPEDEKRSVFDRVVVLRQNGSVEAAERSFEAWRTDCTGTRT